jgi:uncharacterized protein (DUF697 family)
MGAGLIPVLIADIFAISALQLDMIRQLCKVYQINFAETQGKAIVTSLTSSTVARITAGSVVKMIPGLGSIIGGITVSVFAGASKTPVTCTVMSLELFGPAHVVPMALVCFLSYFLSGQKSIYKSQK